MAKLKPQTEEELTEMRKTNRNCCEQNTAKRNTETAYKLEQFQLENCWFYICVLGEETHNDLGTIIEHLEKTPSTPDEVPF